MTPFSRCQQQKNTIMMKKNLIGLIIIGSMLVGLSQETEIHLAGIFPINGVEGWQGGQVLYISCTIKYIHNNDD